VDELAEKDAPTRIKFLWEMVTHERVLYTPVLSVDPADPASERLHTATGRLILTARRSSERVNNIDAIYEAEAEISAPLASYGDNLYVATVDSNLIALSIREIREPATGGNTLPRGKFTTGGPVEQEMLLTDEAVYAIGSRWGLIKLRHGTLEPFWNERLPDGRIRPKPNPDIIRLLGVNSSYVYGINRLGHLGVVDAIRGQTLSSFDVSAFTVPVTNEANDRVFLAANNGLVVALHDRTRVRGEPLIKPAPKAKPAGDGPIEPEAPKKDPEKK
jgi:outer membrane protein assembly factor BamB